MFGHPNTPSINRLRGRITGIVAARAHLRIGIHDEENLVRWREEGIRRSSLEKGDGCVE